MRAVACAAVYLSTLALAGCADETLSAYGAGDKIWVLESIDRARISGEITLTFPKPGTVSGKASCNRYNASQSAPYPWFTIGPILSTKMACPGLNLERRYLSALSEMSISEVNGDTLILSNDAKREMIFKAR